MLRKLKIYLKDYPNHTLGRGFINPTNEQNILERIYQTLNQEPYKNLTVLKWFYGTECLNRQGDVLPNIFIGKTWEEENKVILREYVLVYCQEQVSCSSKCVEWIEPRPGMPDDACVTLRCSIDDAIKIQRYAAANSKMKYIYKNDKDALQDFLAVHHASLVEK